jgi:hypothetical protein
MENKGYLKFAVLKFTNSKHSLGDGEKLFMENIKKERFEGIFTEI